MKNTTKITTEQIYGFLEFPIFAKKNFSHEVTTLVDNIGLIRVSRAPQISALIGDHLSDHIKRINFYFKLKG